MLLYFLYVFWIIQLFTSIKLSLLQRYRSDSFRWNFFNNQWNIPTFSIFKYFSLHLTSNKAFYFIVTIVLLSLNNQIVL